MAANEGKFLKAEGYALMASAFDVYNQLGPGFLEEVYQEALEIELDNQSTKLSSKPRLQIHYKDQVLRKYYEAGLLVCEPLIIELKAVRVLSPEHEAQLMNELKASHMRVGCLINFGASPRLEWHRRVDSSVH